MQQALTGAMETADTGAARVPVLELEPVGFTVPIHQVGADDEPPARQAQPSLT